MNSPAAKIKIRKTELTISSTRAAAEEDKFFLRRTDKSLPPSVNEMGSRFMMPTHRFTAPKTGENG